MPSSSRTRRRPPERPPHLHARPTHERAPHRKSAAHRKSREPLSSASPITAAVIRLGRTGLATRASEIVDDKHPPRPPPALATAAPTRQAAGGHVGCNPPRVARPVAASLVELDITHVGYVFSRHRSFTREAGAPRAPTLERTRPRACTVVDERAREILSRAAQAALLWSPRAGGERPVTRRAETERSEVEELAQRA